MKRKKSKLQIKDLAGKKQEIKFLAEDEIRVVAGGRMSMRTQGGTCTACDDYDC